MSIPIHCNSTISDSKISLTIMIVMKIDRSKMRKTSSMLKWLGQKTHIASVKAFERCQ